MIDWYLELNGSKYFNGRRCVETFIWSNSTVSLGWFFVWGYKFKMNLINYVTQHWLLVMFLFRFRHPDSIPAPHTNRLICVAHVYLVATCTNIYIFLINIDKQIVKLFISEWRSDQVCQSWYWPLLSYQSIVTRITKWKLLKL